MSTSPSVSLAAASTTTSRSAPARVLIGPEPSATTSRSRTPGPQHAPAAFDRAPGGGKPVWWIVGAVAAASFSLLAVVAGFALGSGKVTPPDAAIITPVADGADSSWTSPALDVDTGTSPVRRPAPAGAGARHAIEPAGLWRGLDLDDPAVLGGPAERALGALAVGLLAALNSQPTTTDPLATFLEVGLPVDDVKIPAAFAHPTCRNAVAGADPAGPAGAARDVAVPHGAGGQPAVRRRRGRRV